MRDTGQRSSADRPDEAEDGPSLAEFALILGLIAIIAIISVILLGDSLGDLMSYIADEIDGAS